MMFEVGTLISRFATPVARMFNSPCVDQATGDLRQDSTCAKVRDHLDAGRWGDALYDFIWRNNGVKETVTETTATMKDWIIIHQMGIQAETYMDAMSGMKDAETIAVTVQQRQQAPNIVPQPARQVASPAMSVGSVAETKSDKK